MLYALAILSVDDEGAQEALVAVLARGGRAGQEGDCAEFDQHGAALLSSKCGRRGEFSRRILDSTTGASNTGAMFMSRLPFSIDPLIAEAKRRMRRRRFVLLAVVVLVAAGVAVVRPSVGLLREGSSHAGPYQPGGMFRGTGGPPISETGGTVSAVSVASAGDAWALGAVAFHWDGRAWRTAPLPRIGAADLWAVADGGPTDAWAVGARGNGSLVTSHALIEHWDGVRWRVARLPHLAASYLYGVTTTGPRSAWAVGATYGTTRATFASKSRPLLLHWDGRSWRKQALPWARPGVVLDKVVANGPIDVWAVSSGQEDSIKRPVAIEHWDGVRWRAAPSPFGATDPFLSFSATAWNDAWAVGSYSQRGNSVAKFSRPLAAHWDGRSWGMTDVPNPAGKDNSFALDSVVAVRPDNVLALGESQSLELDGENEVSGSGPIGYFLHWNGQSWTVMPGRTPSIFDGEPAVAAGRDGSAWAVGRCRADGFLVRLAAMGWATVEHPQDEHWAGPFQPDRPPTC